MVTRRHSGTWSLRGTFSRKPSCFLKERKGRKGEEGSWRRAAGSRSSMNNCTSEEALDALLWLPVTTG